MAQIQIVAVYFHAAISKMGVKEWADGTALFYYFQLPGFSGPTWAREFIEAALSSSLVVATLTWSALVIELSIALAPLFPALARRSAFWLGAALHVGIGVFLGLPSFSMVMLGALLILLRTPDGPLKWRQLAVPLKHREKRDDEAMVIRSLARAPL